MKGTFFSSDFIKDSDGNFKYLEVNTDTATESSALQLFDWSGFKTILVDNNITQLDLIYKPFANTIIDHLETYISQDSELNNIQIVKHEEDISSIYPVEIDESETTFVLRFAYSESALLDSEYAKNNLNFYNLFRENNESNVFPELYHSSSEYLFETLTSNSITPENNIPDIIGKEIVSTPGTSGIKFYNIGQSSLDIQDRLNQFIDVASTDTSMLQRFYNTIENNRVKSYRSFDIVYGSNLDIINIASFSAQSPYQIPNENDIIFDDNEISNQLDTKYFLDYTTKTPHRVRSYRHGLFEEEKVIKSDGTVVLVKDLQVGDELKSFHISGSPDTDDTSQLLGWSLSGSKFPSGSYETTTTVVATEQAPLGNQFIIKIEIENGMSFRLAPSTLVLIYDSVEDKILYRQATNINVASDKLIKQDDTLVTISDVKYEILDGQYLTIGLDVEDEDTYFLSLDDGSETPVHLKLIIHNFFKPGGTDCFVAGTEITLENGDVKNIEDIVEGDTVLTCNMETFETQPKKVLSTLSEYHTGEDDDYTIKITLSNGTINHNTNSHPYFVKEKGWVSYRPDITLEKYNLQVGQLEIGDIVYTYVRENELDQIEITGIEESREGVRTYNLSNVEDNHNFFANKTLVHNKKCFIPGAKVLMSDGTWTPIENVNIGDEVTTMDGDTTIVEDVFQYDVQSEMTMYTNGDVTVTNTHPMYLDGSWKTADDAGWDMTFMYVDKLYNLKTNSNFIIEGIPADGTTHNNLVIEKNPITGYTNIINKNLVG